MNRLVVLTGSNLGNSKVLLSAAEMELIKYTRNLLAKSPLVSSPPFGFEHPNNFVNQVLVFETKLLAEQCLEICLSIEKRLGRKRIRQKGYSARLIDIDILFYNSDVLNSKKLCIPHQKLHERRFTLLPLSLVMPDFVHPVLGKSIRELLENCEDKSVVRILK